MRKAAIAGLGIAYVYEDDALDDIRAGRLMRVLEDWCPLLPGYFLYHPSPAMAALRIRSASLKTRGPSTRTSSGRPFSSNSQS